MRSYNQQVSNVFGNVSAQLDRGRISTLRSNTERQMNGAASMMAPSMIDSESRSEDLASSTYGSLDAIPTVSLITTAGRLATTQPGQVGLPISQTATGDGVFSNFMDGILEGTAHDYSFMEDGPLFALMHDYYPV